MYNLFIAQCLVIFLLFISGLRIFFIKDPRVDATSVASPFAFIVSIFIVYIWGVSIQSMLLLFISGLFFFTNIRALFRLGSELLVDHYSGLFVVATIIELLGLLLVSAFIIYFRPVKFNPSDFSVEKKTFYLSGNLVNGFRIQDEYQDKFKSRISGKLNVYSPIEKIEWISSEDSVFNKLDTQNDSSVEKIKADEAPLLLFVGTPFATVDNYESYFVMLSQKGFTVLAADFFSNDEKFFADSRDYKLFRRSAFLNLLKNEPEKFEIHKKHTILDYTKKKYEILTKLALVNFKKSDNTNKKIYYLTDGMSSDDIFSFSDKFKENVAGVFQMDLIPEYKTSGFGFIEQTDTYLAWKMGIERDSEFFIPRYLTYKTIQKIGFNFNQKTKNIENTENVEEKNESKGTE